MFEISSVILAGGKSKRFGKKKAFLKIRGRTLIDQIVEKMGRLSNEIIIVTNILKKFDYLPKKFDYLNVKLIKDIIPYKGSLGGIYSGLLFAKNNSTFVVACDMPFLNISLLKHIISYSNEYDVVIPKVDNFFEPLHATYSKRCLKPIKKLIDSDNLKIIDFFKEVSVKFVEKNEIEKFDPNFMSLFNVNTLNDFKIATEWIKSQN
ncbi:MAG: molybdenum cofactor guanylyltransferase [Actinomycetota bacterium]